MIKHSLIKIKVTNKLTLDGVFCTNENNTSRSAAIILHGAALNFYTGISSFLPSVIAETGFNCLAINFRSHDFGNFQNSFRKKNGLPWQIHNHNILDVKSAIKFLETQKYEKIILIGHSLGGLIAAAYSVNSTIIVGLILLSSLPSYDLMLKVNYGDTFPNIVKMADMLLSQGFGEKLILTQNKSSIPGFSAKTIIDMLVSKVFLDEILANIKIPILFIVGGNEHIELINKHKEWISNEIVFRTLIVIKGSNHFYHGYEEQVKKHIKKWLISHYSLNNKTR